MVASRDEGGPRAVLESMATGVPLVTTRVGQAADLVEHGVNGWMVDVEAVEALAASIEHVAEASSGELDLARRAGRVPADNLFVGVEGDDRVWAYGLRDPWRYSFDQVSGDLWLGDVGQEGWEEVEEIVSGGNYGWDCWEGNAVYEDVDCSSPPTPFLFPRAVYDHSLGCSVTGGYVYRGTLLPEIYGWYVYGDHCSGIIWTVNPADTSAPVQLVDTDFNIGSFAELPNGELLVLRMFQATDSPGIFRLTCATTPDTDNDGQGNACDLDDDGDGFSDAIESYVGTNLLAACGTDAWPADIDNDTFVDTADIAVLTGNFGRPVPPAPARANIAPNPPDGFVDTADIARMAGLFGTACGP